MCIPVCKRGEIYMLCSERIRVYVYVCATVAFRIPLTVTRVGRRVVLSVIEANIQQYIGK